MSLARLMLVILVRALLCLLVSAACYFMFTALLGATGQSSEKTVIWAMTILTSGVVWVFAFVRPAFAVMGSLADAVRALLWRSESGRYYAFDGQRIRVMVVEGEPWVAEADVLKVLGPKALRHLNWKQMSADEYGEISGTNLKGFSEQGVEKLFAGKTDEFSRRFRKCLIGDVFFPFRRARERGLPLPWT
ncbi:MAG: hypothetical protein HY017_22870 [Betaproteobacteria bacterium]|nr:hypothetical protein [Betaproteobacteria bacterium]